MGLQLYNSLSRRKEAFVPGDPERVTLYVCGPTVYNYAHIGNARPPVVFDLLRRVLGRIFPNVIYARNITDVEDKIMKAAEELGCPIDEITARYTDIYNKDMLSLGVLPPDVEPFATDHIGEMIAMIGTLMDQGHAYAAEGHVLFDVSSYPDYGQLSGRSVDDMIAGARVEVAPYKRNPADFVLWKPSEAHQPGWDSPWGRGRPGWHIECSAMSRKHLGETIDIHGGGADLKFPHHENERAQSVCAHGGAVFARYWMHNGFLTIDQEKMSKSLGNIITVHELLDYFPGEVLRLVLMSAHYRKPLDWSDESLQRARAQLDKMYRALRELDDLGEVTPEPPAELIDALQDDLNTPLALSVVHELVGRANASKSAEERRSLKAALLGCGEMLGLLQQDAETWLRGDHSKAEVSEAEIDDLIARRRQARADRDFAEADRIRDQLKEQGIELEDGPDGTRWSYR